LEAHLRLRGACLHLNGWDCPSKSKIIGKKALLNISREEENEYTSWENTEKYKKEKE